MLLAGAIHMDARPARGLRGAFTLIELLVVVAIIALLISILLPSLRSARHQARVTVDLSNFRSLSMAHWMYITENNGWFVDVGLSHGGGAGLDADVSWIRTLESTYGKPILRKSPLDDSPHWPPGNALIEAGMDKAIAGEGIPVPGLPADEFPWRRSSYGMNNLLTRSAPAFNADAGRNYEFDRLGRIKRPSDTVVFLFMAEEGEFAGADHTHIEDWQILNLYQVVPRNAASEVQTNSVSGPAADWTSVSNYAFVDGHAETRRFDRVFRRRDDNNFWPDAAR
jgi:prepilin-type N-terminal cleavage/methylation domain-containing protein/prepilin-type processing-associated H-X9-DG protein